MRRLALGLVAILSACAGTETGNPPTRGVRCGECPACEAPIVLSVTDAETGEPISGVSADGASEACEEEATRTVCRLAGAAYSSAGPHVLVVAAAGYEPVEIEVEVIPGDESCCPCNRAEGEVAVTLEHLP